MSYKPNTTSHGLPDPDSPPRPWTGPLQAFSVLLLCLLSRTATTIHHVEDADSLRFALGVLDYDIARLQPQFPGYAAFMGVVKSLGTLTGSYSMAFSTVGGLGLFVLVHYSLSILRWRFAEPRGLAMAALLAFNPMTWLLGNRYMSDLSGAACMLAAFYHLSRADSRRHFVFGFFLTGILAGWRLSYAPFLLVPALLNLFRSGAPLRARAEMLLAGAAGTLAWMIPLIAVTGWSALLETARRQTSAHFLATGGTYLTENSWLLRVRSLLVHLWADGLGAWMPGRHAATGLVATGAIAFLILGLRNIRFSRSANFGHTPASVNPALRLLPFAAVAYCAWILLFQNVIHQTRHVLPLVPPLLMLLAAGLAAPVRLKSGRPGALAMGAKILATLVFIAAYAFVGVSLAIQHMKPAAIAQAKVYVESFADSSTVIVTAPWVEKCLSAQGARSRFLSVETPEELDALPARIEALPAGTRLAAVGDYRDMIRRPVLEHRTFHHNPYVNRLGARIEVFLYGSEGEIP